MVTSLPPILSLNLLLLDVKFPKAILYIQV